MTDVPLIECEVTFLSADEGGRATGMPSLSSGSYWPLMVIGDPNQRKAIITGAMLPVEYADGTKGEEWSDNYCPEEHIGVRFEYGPHEAAIGKPFVTTLSVPFWSDTPLFRKINPEATFTLREGHRIVGFGKVIRWVSQP